MMDRLSKGLIIGALALVVAACSAPKDSAPAPGNTAFPGGLSDCLEAQFLAEFPWPFPQYSVAQTVPRAVIFSDADPTDATLLDVAERIERGLTAAGYLERSFYRIECDGFAIVTRLEQIDASGVPVPQAIRFESGDEGRPFSLTTYLSQLFYAPPGFYRQITFVVTPKAISGDGSDTTQEDLDALLDEGSDALPDAFSVAPFTPRHDVTALIYEFRANGNREADILIPGRIPGQSHLDVSGISAALSGPPG